LNERAAGVVGELVLSLVTASCGAWVGPDLGAGANGGTDAGRTAASRVGELVAVHVIARPHQNVDEVLPLGRGAKAIVKK